MYALPPMGHFFVVGLITYFDPFNLEKIIRNATVGPNNAK